MKFIPDRRSFPSFFAAAVIVILLSIFTLVSPRFIPYNMDEFSGQHALGCAHFPLSDKLQHYDESCQKYELTPAGFHHPLRLRSYGYVGSILVAPFYPLWLVIQDPISARIQGLLFFLLAAWLVAMIAKTRFIHGLVASLVFPLYFLNALADTGISNIAIVCFLGSVLLLQRLPDLDSRKRYMAGVSLGLLVFIGMWAKMTFAWFFPQLLIYLLFALFQNKEWKKRALMIWPALIAAAVACAIPSLWLFTALNDQGLSYVASNGSQLDTSSQSISKVFHFIAPFLLDGSLSVNRILAVTHHSYDIVPLLLGLLLGAWALLQPRTRAIAFWSLVGVLILFATMLSFRATAHPHHVMLLMPVFAIGTAKSLELLSRKSKIAFSIFFLVLFGYWASYAIRLPEASVSGMANRNKDLLLADIRKTNLASTTVQIHASWGTYYIANVFGPSDQAVLFAYDVQGDPERLKAISTDAKELHRNILILTSNSADVLHSPHVKAMLGDPVSQIVEGNWSAIEYKPY